MTELDIEALKQLRDRVKHGLALAGQDTIATGDPTLLPLSQLNAIIAALEDRERLRAGERTVQAELVRLYRIETAAKRAEGLCARSTACGAILRAALEGHDG